MKETRTTTVTTSITTCDVCGTELSTPHTCPGCGKDICGRCGNWWTYDRFTGNDNGDYPPLVCNTCHELALKVCGEARDIQQEADERVEAIVTKWKADCMGRE